jgi:hypothetical protein
VGEAVSLFGPLMAPLLRHAAMASGERHNARFRVIAYVAAAIPGNWDDAAGAVDAAAPFGEEAMFDTSDGMAVVAGEAIHALRNAAPPPFITAVCPC